MVAAVEKYRYIYLIGESKQSIISALPIEIQKSKSLIYNICNLKNSLGNPIFSTIEVDKSMGIKGLDNPNINTTSRFIIFYELDLGLSMMITIFIDKINLSNSMIIPLEEKSRHSPGCLIAGDSKIILKNSRLLDVQTPNFSRLDTKKTFNTSFINTFNISFNNESLQFVQSELGDIFLINYTDFSKHPILRLLYLQTIYPSKKIIVLNRYYLYAISTENYDIIYKIEKTSLKATLVNESPLVCLKSSSIYYPIVFKFSQLKVFSIVKKLFKINPVTFGIINRDKLKRGSSRISLCIGYGLMSRLIIMEFGYTTRVISKSSFSKTPLKIWTVQLTLQRLEYPLVVISFSNTTLSFSVDQAIREEHYAGIIGSSATLFCAVFNNDLILQINKNFLRVIYPNHKIKIWKCPNKKNISLACANNLQVVLKLNDNILLYFELMNQQLQYIDNINIKEQITSIDISKKIIKNNLEEYLGIVINNKKLFFLSLKKEMLFNALFSYHMPVNCVNLKIMEVVNQIHICVSFSNGAIMIMKTDNSLKYLSQPFMRFLGEKVCSFSTIEGNNLNKLIILADKTFLGFFEKNYYIMKPLAFKGFDDVSSISLKGIQALAGIISENMYIVSIIIDDSLFSYYSVNMFARASYIVNYNHYSKSIIIQNEIYKNQNIKMNDSIKMFNGIQILDFHLKKQNFFLTIQKNEKVLCEQIVNYKVKNKILSFILLGTKLLKSYRGYLYLFKFSKEACRIHYIHRTFVDGPPLCITRSNNHIIIGSLGKIHVYKIGKKKLLKIFEKSIYNSYIIKILCLFNRIIILDFNEGLLIGTKTWNPLFIKLYYSSLEGRLSTRIINLDFDTFLICDIIGNIIITRITQPQSIKMTIDPTLKQNSQTHIKIGFVSKIASYFINEMIVTMMKFKFYNWKEQLIVYFTLNGTIGCLFPIQKKSENLLLKNIMINLRNNVLNLTPYNILLYRSSYYPSKHIIDGDYCISYINLIDEQKKSLSSHLKVNPKSLERFLSELKFRIL